MQSDDKTVNEIMKNIEKTGVKGEFIDGIYHPKFTPTEERSIKLIKNFNETSDQKLTIEQRKELIKDMFDYLHDRFGCDFSKVILTHNSNFYDNSPLLWCHKFMAALSLKNINYENSSFRIDEYGVIRAILYMGEHDFIEFINVGRQYCTVRFSVDIVGNHFVLKYPFPLVDEKVEENLEKPTLERSNSEPVIVN